MSGITADERARRIRDAALSLATARVVEAAKRIDAFVTFREDGTAAEFIELMVANHAAVAALVALEEGEGK